MEIQIKEALVRKPGATLKVNEIVTTALWQNWRRKGSSIAFTNSDVKDTSTNSVMAP
jgi:hypothetical protein